SSIYPTSIHPDYGIGSSPLSIYETKEGIMEIPLSCCERYGIRIPCSGGAYFRFIPYILYKKLIDQILISGRNFVFYIHPWEIDEKMPRVKLPILKGIRHYSNISTTKQKIKQLLQDFEFTS